MDPSIDPDLAGAQADLTAGIDPNGPDAIVVDDDDHPPELDTAGGTHAHLLELHGFAEVRGQVLQVVQVIASLPLEALEATVAYNQTAIARLTVEADPRAKDALKTARLHHVYLAQAVRFRKSLKSAEEKFAAVERLRP